jgi:hypothetical protein
MTESQIQFFCCDEHNDAYIEARRQSRIQGAEWTSEEHHALIEIEAHLARQRPESR